MSRLNQQPDNARHRPFQRRGRRGGEWREAQTPARREVHAVPPLRIECQWLNEEDCLGT